MGFIVLPYLGARAAGRELERPAAPRPAPRAARNGRPTAAIRSTVCRCG